MKIGHDKGEGNADTHFKAIDTFAEFERLIIGTPLAARLAAIKPDLQAFRFASVRENLGKILSSFSTAASSP